MTVKPASIPAVPGCYILCLEALHPGKHIRIGRCGNLLLNTGEYLYVGSAHGPGGLKARILHHLGKSRRIHWHVDYLGSQCRVTRVGYASVPREEECRWAARLGSLAQPPLKGFGSSDCRCPAHLFHLSQRLEAPARFFSPDFRWISTNTPVLMPTPGPLVSAGRALRG